MLEYIFALLEQDTGLEQMKLPVCKALLPFQRARLYRQVDLSTESLSPFARALASSPALGSFVKSLKLPDYTKAEVSSAELRAMLATLVNIRDLETVDWSTLKVVKSKSCLELDLHSLISLEIRLNVKLLHLDPLRHLALLPNLEYLSISLYKKNLDTAAVAMRPASTTAPFPSVRNLSVGPYFDSYPEVGKLVARFPNARCTVVYGGKEGLHFGNLLKVCSPRVVEFAFGLPRGIPPVINGATVPSLGAEISHFTWLTTLHTSSPFLDPSFYTALEDLPLEVLGFQLGSAPVLDYLVTLVEKHRTLQVLAINAFEGAFGRVITAEHVDTLKAYVDEVGVFDLNDFDDDDLPFPAPGWVFPHWTEEFQLVDVPRLLRMAASKGVGIAGSITVAVVAPVVLGRQLAVAAGEEDPLFAGVKQGAAGIGDEAAWGFVARAVFLMLVMPEEMMRELATQSGEVE